MPNSRIKISYAAPTNFLASDQWIQIRTALDQHLPLKMLNWKTTDGTVRTIQELEVDFVSLESLKDEGSSQIPSSILERPLMNMYFFACEDSETYRLTFKKMVKDWQTSISTKRNQEWLVVLVVRPDARASAGAARIFAMRAPVLDKVKTDINVDKKKDRCAELAWPVAADDVTAWTDFISKLKDGIVSSFESAVAARQEEIARSESQQQVPGWNFCTYFILKESLATSFEGMGLLEEALQHYEELEASFFQALRDKNLPWFGNVGGTSPGDDSRSLLDIFQKPYRELILNNTITLFDFRIYLFACQMILLAKQERLLDVITKCHLFIVSFARSLRENERSFTTFFLESWIYSASLNIIKQCDEAYTQFTSLHKISSFTLQYSAKRGELVHLSRYQLDKIGIHLGYLPNKPPFSLCWHTSGEEITPRFADGQPLNSKITRDELIAALRSKEEFDALYISTTQRAIEYYAEGKRRKFALRLHGDLAALDRCRSNLQTAHQTFASLPAHYSASRHKWPPLEAFMLARALDSHTKLGIGKDNTWLDSAVAFLGLCCEADDQTNVIGEDVILPQDTTITPSQRKEYIMSLLDDVRRVADGSDDEIQKRDHPSFSLVPTTGIARLAGDRDGSFLDIVVTNLLPCDVRLDRLEMELSGEDDEPFSFVANGSLCTPGDNYITFFCMDTHAGTFHISSCSVWLSKIRFDWVYNSNDGPSPISPHVSTPLSGQYPLRLPSTQQHLVRIPPDEDALNIKLALPRSIQWDADPAVMLELHTGRNVLQDVTINITSPTGVKFKLGDAELLEDSLGNSSSTSFLAESSQVSLKNLKSQQVISFSIPHSAPPAGGVLLATIAASYQAIDIVSAMPQPRRKLRALKKISTAVPLQVSVMDSFRGKTLISKFTVSATTHLQVRILDTRLEGGNGLRISAPLKTSRRVPMIVTPQRQAHFLYELTSEKARYERETLYLHVLYRTLREEIEARLEKEVSKMFKGQYEAGERVKAKLIEYLAADGGWVQQYIHTQELVLQQPSLSSSENELCEGMIAVIESLKSPQSASNDSLNDKMQQRLIIPVDLPFLHILCAVQIHLNADLDSIYAGQPVPVRVEIATSFHWGSIQMTKEAKYSMRYVVQESVTDWLVSGHKRGDFVATDNSTHSVELTLVPLHHGELVLPTVAISPLSTEKGTDNQSHGPPSIETYHVHAAQRILVLPRGGRTTFVVGMGGDA
ncbi:hypothetical protein FRC14_002285 [Serendipita sp. 396]|nr:hypothetical protein FRC14_002285 [Serendipita sp. 396]KAG8800773.1 hypothetical protein FRC16_002107 [Serendipita sp. 398]